MLVINLKVDSHRTLDDVNTPPEGGVYGASRKRSSVKSDEEILEAPKKTVLTEEQEKYLHIYETEHDKYFGSAKKPKDKTEVRIYVSSTKEEEKKEGFFKTLFKHKDEAPVDEVAPEEVLDVVPATKFKASPKEDMPQREEPIVETPVEVEETLEKPEDDIEVVVGRIEEAVEKLPEEEKKNWFKRLLAAIKAFIQRLFRKKKKEEEK
jgi:hypothetical protein